jgi:hypothetical protein
VPAPPSSGQRHVPPRTRDHGVMAAKLTPVARLVNEAVRSDASKIRMVPA